MFRPRTYIERRECLRGQIQNGLILFLGNQESPMNYPDNPYPFRQDSSFLYFFGLDFPNLAAVIDIDEATDCVFGDDPTMDQIIWMGRQPSLKDRCASVGISTTAPMDQLQTLLKKAVNQNRNIHFLPQYRVDIILLIKQLLPGSPLCGSRVGPSETLTKAVVAQRSTKTAEEIEQIEAALDISYQMHTTAMKMSKPGVFEREVAGAMEGIALSRGVRLAFPTIFSIHGETLHNHYYGNMMKAGDMVVNDSGAESPLHYAGDITRTIPVGGKFSPRQRDIYNIVLAAQQKAIETVTPGVEFREIHRLACTILASGLADLGLLKGNIQEAVHAGAHTLFFQCGLGHMLGLDVHDMEALGEDYVGYTDTITRNPEFGWKSLRLARALEPGFVITVEPGVYFIPELIDRWKADNKCADFINYDKVERYRDFGGIRIEDDVLVTPASSVPLPRLASRDAEAGEDRSGGHRILGKPIPKTIEEVESASGGRA